MVAPIDYSLNVRSPFESAIQGVQLGAGLADMQAKRQQAQAEAAAQQQALERQRMVSQQITQLMNNPNPTARDFVNVASLLPEKEAASMRANWETLSKDQQQSKLQFGGQVMAALQADPEVGIKLLLERAQAERNNGNEQEARALETSAEIAKINPKLANINFGAIIASVPGGDKIIEGVTKLGAEGRAAELQPSAVKKAESEAEVAASNAKFADALNAAGLNEKNWNVKNLQSQIGTRAAQLSIDRQRMQTEVAERLSNIQNNITGLDAATKKLINDAAVEASALKQSEGQFNNLAKQLEAAGGGYGAFSSLSEFLKRQGGLQNGTSQLRTEYTRLRNAAAIKSLPPGPATDRDIELALRGFPPENADAKVISQFLRGMAKLQGIEAAVANAKTDWLASNRGVLTRANDTFIAGDYTTKPGESFNDFAVRVADDVAKKYKANSPEARRQALINQIPTDANPRPTQPANNVRAQADAILRGQ